jgi:hypothetical protein
MFDFWLRNFLYRDFERAFVVYSFHVRRHGFNCGENGILNDDCRHKIAIPTYLKVEWKLFPSSLQASPPYIRVELHKLSNADYEVNIPSERHLRGSFQTNDHRASRISTVALSKHAPLIITGRGSAELRMEICGDGVI